MKQKSEIGVFIIWEKGRYISEPILRDIAAKFEIIKVFDNHWPQKEFAARLADFYGTKLPRGCHKERICGAGNFIITVISDPAPHYRNGNNQNMLQAKQLYRAWCRGDNFIHASDNQSEGCENIRKLFQMSAEEFTRCYQLPWNGVIEKRSCAPAEKFNLPQPWRSRLNNLGRQLLQNINLQ